jgi:hypothetical protein
MWLPLSTATSEPGLAQSLGWCVTGGCWLASYSASQHTLGVAGLWLGLLVLAAASGVQLPCPANHRHFPACRNRSCIHSWDICNEPRNRLPNAPSDAIAGWVHEAAGFVKSLDAKHPVTVGSEGFFGPSPPGEQQAEPTAWSACGARQLEGNSTWLRQVMCGF